MLALLSGKKTYLTALFIGLITFAQYMGWIDADVFKQLLALAGATGLAALRAGVDKPK